MRGWTDTGPIDLSVDSAGDPAGHRFSAHATSARPEPAPQQGADGGFVVQVVEGLLLEGRFGAGPELLGRLDELVPLLAHSSDADAVLLSLYARALALQRSGDGTAAALGACDLLERVAVERRHPAWAATASALRARARLDDGDPAHALADLAAVDVDVVTHEGASRAGYYLLDALASAFAGLRLYDRLGDARRRLDATIESRSPVERAIHWTGWALELATAAMEQLARGSGGPDEALLHHAGELADRARGIADVIDAQGGARAPMPLRQRVDVVHALVAVHRGDPRRALAGLEPYLVEESSHPGQAAPGEAVDRRPVPTTAVEQLAVLAAVRAYALLGSAATARRLDDDACRRPVPASGELLELCRARERVWLEGGAGGDPVPALRRLTDLLARVGWQGLDLASHTARQILEQQSLRVQSRTDALTGVGNRRALDEELRAMLRATPLPMALVLVDLDDFKRVNDQFTHVVGDEVLRRVAASMGHGLRGRDRLMRFGGDEFVVLLPQTGDQDARMVAGRMAAAIAELPWGELADGLQVRVTTGCAALWSLTERRPDRDAERLFRRADEALLEAKRRRGGSAPVREWSGPAGERSAAQSPETPGRGTFLAGQPAEEHHAPTMIELPGTSAVPRSGRRAAVIDLSAAQDRSHLH